MKDFQVSRVYKAETKLRKYKQYKTRIECQDFLNRICKSRWWKTKTKRFNVQVELILLQKTTGPDPHTFTGEPYIYMPENLLYYNEYTLCHETTHILMDKFKVPDHGKEFCGIYLSMVRRFMGETHYKILKNRFIEFEVQWQHILTIEKNYD